MERATKLVVLIWACAALAANVWLLRGGWPALPLIALVAFTAAAALASLDRRAVALVLVFAYVFPILVYLHIGRYVAQYDAVWMAALVGAITPVSARSRWHIPTVWRAPIVCWALVIVASGSIVVAREIDFTPALIDVTTISNTARGGWPAFITSWTLHVAVGLIIGILWFDWLLGLPPEHFHSGVATPMAVSCLAMVALAIYQLFGDMSFLNASVYQSMGRASATVLDANVCGTIAALWVGGSVLWADRFGRFRAPLSAGGILACWLAVWATGSRTAFAAATLVTIFSLRGFYLSSRRTTSRLAVAQVSLGAAAVCALLLFLATADLGALGPLARFRESLPSLSSGSVRSFLAEQLWIRNGYGTAASLMIRQYPWFGGGVGSFQSLLPEFADGTGNSIPPDNAQNWYRHQLAEFGIVGSVGWIAFVVAFAVFVLRRRTNEPRLVWSARGALIAFAAISFVGMPGQEITVAVTFWTLAAWYISIVGRPGSAPLKLPSWAGVVVVVAAYAAGTVHAATHQLRVPIRAQRGGWPYTYGLYPPEPNYADGNFRWTRRRAVAVLEAPTRWMELTVSADYRVLTQGRVDVLPSQAATRPVDVKIWRDGDLILDAQLTTTEPVTRVVAVRDTSKRLLLETWVSRVFTARELGASDDRELGLLVRWSFVDAPSERHAR